MKKDVFIEIRGRQQNDEGTDVTELLTEGLLCRQNGKYYLIYDESEATGYESCRTTLKLEDERKISMRRTGASRSELTIERGVRNVGFYGTVAGDLQIGVFAEEIQNRLTDEGGQIYFKYQLDVNSVFLSENEVTINVKSE